MRGVTKRFPGIVANDRVNLRVKKGEIHALLGENGAGKSTLMNILFGLYQPDEGEILIHGKPVNITSPRKANEWGIGMVHQHFMLVEPFTVTENIILGKEPRKGLGIDIKTAAREVAAISARYGLSVDPYAKIEDISVGMQQRVEILKTLYRGAEILILDEPTAVLTPQEIRELMEIMENLVAEGKTIILITHKLKEIMAVCDSVTIIRRGKVVDSLAVAETTPDELAAKMVGREVSFRVDKQSALPQEVILAVENVTALDNRGLKALDGISFAVRAGEILGIAGVDGNGQSELVEVLTGLRKVEQGSIKLKGVELSNRTPREISAAGVSHIPEDRQKRGLVLDFTLSENMVLSTYHHPRYSKNGFLDYRAIAEQAARLVAKFDVRTASTHTLARALSGGNQQKAVIAREVEKDPDLLIAAQPTRGLDVGAIEFIHRQLIEQRDKGKAVLLLSLELDEIMKLADRIAVIYEGKIVGIVDPNQTDEQELGLMMAGSSRQGGRGDA
ncbi:ABC transporter ATP-binding protein [Brevibacillus marinus]|uniref:ABC transporter ATP-binding protein n=1 Tax=Brevibacillus marinus TaxID=2496837 RepID=UPI000F81A001|nr:ABC transporter ATP-binding protein [Brevibacillus marinus]